jgi:DNA-binding Xre family transcriptional regulator
MEGQSVMTKLGEFLAKNKINRASLSRQTGISEPRLTRLSNSMSAKLQGKELYRIALAIKTPPPQLLKFIYIGLELKEDPVNGDKKSLSKKKKKPPEQ